MPSPVFIQEFLFRGRCSQHEPDRSSAWHVVLGQFVEQFGEVRLVSSGTLTPAQASEQDFDLADVVEGINVEALALADARQATINDLTAANSALQSERTQLEAQVVDLTAGNSALASEKAQLQGQIIALQARVAELESAAS